MAVKKKDAEQKGILKTMRSLDKHMELLASHYEPHRYLWMGFIRGIVYGLGIVVAVALVLPFIIYLLSTIDWIPFIGDFVSEIAERMQQAGNGY
ncbi:MAG: DUF5665 domain-containing protein [Candidatus Peribacteraceae bacterium]|jgi:hypothetical protein|nr:DUF5665 domain-containing protein [Candidatus Peribacteraceae bacterium]MDP7477444.1 DUF5665 domain-containing protein [Candidatus Peribacteraceae bacterium]